MKDAKITYPLPWHIPAGETDTYLVRGGIGEERKRLCAPAHIPCTGCRVSETLGWAWSPVSGEKEVDTIHTPGGTQKHVYAGQPGNELFASRKGNLRQRADDYQGTAKFSVLDGS